MTRRKKVILLVWCIILLGVEIVALKSGWKILAYVPMIGVTIAEVIFVFKWKLKVTWWVPFDEILITFIAMSISSLTKKWQYTPGIVCILLAINCCCIFIAINRRFQAVNSGCISGRTVKKMMDEKKRKDTETEMMEEMYKNW